MPNGKGNLECYYCEHYRNPWSHEAMNSFVHELSFFLKRLKERNAASSKTTEDALMDFFDFLTCGGREGEKCDFHRADLPCETSGNRICRDFAPSEKYDADNPIQEIDGITKRYFEAEERFSWFKIELEPGVLYSFPYHQPEQIERIKRIDDKANSIEIL